jgi:hypothetical protein
MWIKRILADLNRIDHIQLNTAYRELRIANHELRKSVSCFDLSAVTIGRPLRDHSLHEPT